MYIDHFAPDTRASLLARVCTPADEAAWSEFVSIYAPAIYRTLRSRGIQDSDALDLVQQVLLSVAKSLQRRPHDLQRAKFRTWLSQVVRNAFINAIQRRTPDAGSGDSAVHQHLNAIPAGREESDLVHEVQREIFVAAADAIQPEFSEGVWSAFWMTAIEGLSVEEVAKSLQKSVGSVYAARSRVMGRLRCKVAELQAAFE